MPTKTKKPGAVTPSDSKNSLPTALIMTEPSPAGQGKTPAREPLILHGLDDWDRELVATFRQIVDRENGCNSPVEELITDLVRMYAWRTVSTPAVIKRCEEFTALAEGFEDDAVIYIRHNPKLLDKLLAAGAPEGR